MSRTVVLLIVLAAVIGIPGCGCSSEPTQPTPLPSTLDAARLFAARTPYLGDNSGDQALLDEVRAGAIGPYTMALETTQRPYVLTLTFSALNGDVDVTTLTRQMDNAAVLLLALIGNADEVRWTFPEGTPNRMGAMTVARARELAGVDVKARATTAAGVRGLLDALQNRP